MTKQKSARIIDIRPGSPEEKAAKEKELSAAKQARQQQRRQEAMQGYQNGESGFFM